MERAVIRVFIFMMVLVLFFLWIGRTITIMTGGEKKAVAAVGVDPEAGEAIYFGKGKCSTCHSVGDKGSAIRCPNHGVSGDKFPLPMGERAVERALEREKKTGKKYTAVDYLIECIAEPGAYVVEGYKNEMPHVYKPPISLTPDEVKAVISFLQSVGGDVDIAAINNPPGEGKRLFGVIRAAAASAKEAVPFKPYIQGDPAEGEKLFFDLKSNAGCGKCHTIKDKGGKVGPELTDVAGTRPIEFIIESVMDPSKEIASGFEPILVITTDSRYITGVKKNEDDKMIEIAQATGEWIKIPKGEISRVAPQKKSIMPGNFRELLTMKDFHDILAYLQSLIQVEEASQEASPEPVAGKGEDLKG